MPKTSRKSSAKPSGEPSNSPFVPEVKESEHTPLDLPDWYKNIKNTSQAMKQLSKRPSSDQTQALIALQSMKGCMDRCEKEGVTPAQLAKLFEELRDHVHKAEILLKVDRLVVRKAKMLEEATGLPRIFAAKRVDFPWDLKADAFQLYNRWRMQVFELDILRGIRARPGTDRGADSIDPTWPYRVSAKFYGEGNLVLGQWWPTQLTTVRDGAHGSPQAGIFGEKGMGAYSVVLSGTGSSYYNDEDNGNDIWYSGTDGQNFTPTDNTNRLIETCDTLHNPVRVLRSHNLPNSNPYRPEVGFRYDGLYDVVEKKLVHAAKQKYKFHLVRCKGQFPIRCEDNAARRPTRFEIAEDDRLRKSGR
ncbi:hypothetical protein K458DRAFT_310172 [Lentithecium fluviatile CBS 122367]|uniref:YDG domain-containing protein n=1 Tax=Lentithecium fluviatile CBS 122367 TaxID=1168545 RepID=A0A6G1ISR3_9PLEO|nr:hypothetical protein K458DRAFT_310172 [Lentithecium fluviatile CBS 122367]